MANQISVVFPKKSVLGSAVFKVLRTISDIKLCIVSNDEYATETYKDKSGPILLVGFSSDELNKLYWQEIRPSLLNPVIILGDSKAKSFLILNPVFKTRYHSYIEAPWRLPEIFNAFEEVVPIHDDATRQILYNNYGGGYVLDRIRFLIDHELKNPDLKKNLEDLDEALSLSMKLQDKGLEDRLKSAIELRKYDDLGAFKKLRNELLNILKTI